MGRLYQGIANALPYDSVLKGGNLSDGVIDLLGGLSGNTYVARVQVGLLRRAIKKVPGLSVPAPVISVKSYDAVIATANVLETQTTAAITNLGPN